MAITAADVKNLRDITGAGMMDCKKALTTAEGDMAKAEKILKEMGLAAVAKRQDRATDNGRVAAKIGNNIAALVELSCETDFVANNEQFKDLTNAIAEKVVAEKITDINNAELKAMVDGLIAIIKENMGIKKIVTLPVPAKGYATSYIHSEGAVGVVVVLDSDNADVFKQEEIKEFAHDCALHIAAFKPQFLAESNIDKAFEEEQLSIFKAQVASMGKPEKVLEGIVRGKLNKLYAEICLLKQPFVKDDTMSVEKKLAELSKKYNANISINNFSFLISGAN
ncbi:MAG: elongation factor Ts [Spirochaetales bacterium]|nr:elongation factor Ts [Spirochaetales bacterium]